MDSAIGLQEEVRARSAPAVSILLFRPACRNGNPPFQLHGNVFSAGKAHYPTFCPNRGPMKFSRTMHDDGTQRKNAHKFEQRTRTHRNSGSHQ